jgi:hypothetical protein
MQTRRLMGRIYEVRRRDGIRCQNYTNQFINIGSGIQNLWGGGVMHRDTDSTEIALANFNFFKIREVG